MSADYYKEEEEEFVAGRWLVIEAEPAVEGSLAEKGEAEGGQRGDLAVTEISCYKLEGVKLLCVLAVGWLGKHACGDEIGNV